MAAGDPTLTHLGALSFKELKLKTQTLPQSVLRAGWENWLKLCLVSLGVSDSRLLLLHTPPFLVPRTSPCSGLDAQAEWAGLLHGSRHYTATLARRTGQRDRAGLRHLPHMWFKHHLWCQGTSRQEP